MPRTRDFYSRSLATVRGLLGLDQKEAPNDETNNRIGSHSGGAAGDHESRVRSRQIV